jgi:pyruvate kinase
LIAKIETIECIDNIDSIIELVDGIIVNKRKLAILVGKEKLLETRNKLINICNRRGKPISIHTDCDIRAESHEAMFDTIREEIALGVDSFVMNKETTISDDPFFFVEKLYEIINS